MLKKLILVPLLALPFAACGTAASGPDMQKFAKDPQVQRDQQILYDQAEKCFKGPRSLSKKGRDAFMTCFLPPERKEAGRTCTQKQIQKRGIPLTKKRRTLFMQELAHCLVVTK